MKMKFFFILSISIGLVMTSCKKADSNTNSTADPNAKQHNEDVSNTKSESDNVNTDVNNALNGTSGFRKNGAVGGISICGASIDSSGQYSTPKTLIFNFDGTTACDGRKRSGKVKVELISGNKWSDVGAVLRVTHTNYKVTYLNLNNHYLTFNGTKYLTDVNGFNLLSIYLGDTVKVKERCYDMQVTFENGQTSLWESARLSGWWYNGTGIYAIVNGDTIIGGKTIDSWGVTRYGTNFKTEMVQPWKSGTVCGWWRPTQGIYTSTTDNFSITATLGVNSSGTQVSTGCPGYFKLNWTINSPSSTGNAVLSYF